MSLSWEFIPPPPAVPERPPTPPAKPAPRPVRIKATYQGRTVEFYLEPVTQDVFNWQALQSRVSSPCHQSVCVYQQTTSYSNTL